MDHRLKLVALASLLLCGSAFAGYAQVTPPLSFTNAAGVLQYQAAANDVSFANGVRGASGVMNVGGRAITMPAAYRFASNAGQIAARAAFLNPAWFIGASALTLAYNYYQSQNFVIDAGTWKKLSGGVVCQAPATCYEYKFSVASVWQKNLADACKFPNYNSGGYSCGGASITGFVSASGTGPTAMCTYTRVGSNCAMAPSNRVTAPYDTRTLTPVSQGEFESTMSPVPIPYGVPQELPIPLPVEVPILNPSADPVPVPQPMRVPMGEPVPVPNTNPQQWKTPVVDLVPKVLSPWVVDVQPKDILKENATPLPDAEPVPVTPPAGQEEAPVTPDLCEKNPDILACQKVGLGTLEPSVITSTDKALSITKDTGWGPENGTCPAPKTAVVMGVQLSLPFTMLCDFALGIRPLLLGFAWLSAALTFIGFGRKD